MKRIAVIAGSARRESYSRAVAKALERLHSGEFRFEYPDPSLLALYNEDLDTPENTPPEWTAFREQIRAAEGVIFITPEYNRGVPPLLKNALDVASRPYGQSAWNGKPAAVISISVGVLGGYGANHQLRQSLVFLNMPVMQQPEAYIGNIGELSKPDGTFAPETEKFLADFLQAYADFCNRF